MGVTFSNPADLRRAATQTHQNTIKEHHQMTTRTTADTVAAATAARDAGIDHLRELRERVNASRAERARLAAEEETLLAEAERAFAEAEAESSRRQELAEAHEHHAAGESAYRAAQAAADEAIATVDQLTIQLADAFANAVALELSRLAAGERYRSAWAVLNRLDPVVGELPIPGARLHQQQANPATLGVQHIAVNVHPNVEQQLHQLASHRWSDHVA